MTQREFINFRNEKGASLVEYALAICCIAVLCAAAAIPVGNAVSGNFSAVSDTMGGACGGRRDCHGAGDF